MNIELLGFDDSFAKGSATNVSNVTGINDMYKTFT